VEDEVLPELPERGEEAGIDQEPGAGESAQMVDEFRQSAGFLEGDSLPEFGEGSGGRLPAFRGCGRSGAGGGEEEGKEGGAEGMGERHVRYYRRRRG
jgi:hypothetical protein